MVTVEPLGVALQIREQQGSAMPHRRVLQPGRIVMGMWVATDTSGEPDEVKGAAAVAWTPDAVSAYRAAAWQQWQDDQLRLTLNMVGGTLRL